MDSFLQAELDTLNVRKKAFNGSYRVSIRYLKPEDCSLNLRQLDPENVARLIKMYELVFETRADTLYTCVNLARALRVHSPCRIRMAYLQGQREEKRKWLIRLSKSKQRDVLQLKGRAGRAKNSEMCEFSDELNKLILFRGL